MGALRHRLVCLSFALAVPAFALEATAETPAPAPAGWAEMANDEGAVLFMHPSDEGLIVEQRGLAPGRLDAMLSLMASSSPCKGLSNARDVSALAGAGLMRKEESGGMSCRLLWGAQSDGTMAVSMAIEATTGELGVHALQAERMAGYVRTVDGFGQSKAPAARGGPQAAGEGPSDSTLKALLDQVPASSRPIDVVLQSSYRIDGTILQTRYEPLLLFADGVATYCPEWNPITVPATPDGFARAGLDCELLAWRRTGTQYQIRDSDGVWGEPLSGVENKGAKPGRRVSFSLESSDSFSTLGNYGSPGLLILNEGSLLMTPEGAIQMGSSRLVWRNGDSDSSSDAPLVGRYYLDGFLIAIGDAQGQTATGVFIDFSEDGRSYVYIDDTFFYPGE